MSYFDKEFKLDRQENFEEFIDNLPGLGEDYKQVLKTFKPTLKIVKKDAKSYTLYTSKPDNTIKEVTFQDGVEFDEQVTEGLSCKTKFTIDGNVIAQVQIFDNGGRIVTNREFSDSEVIVSVSRSEWDGVARRYYK